MQSKIKNFLLFFAGMALMVNIAAIESDRTQGTVPALSSNMIELPVSGYSDAEREQVFVQALTLILIRSSNNQNIVNVPVIKVALSKPRTYVTQFNYASKGTAATNKSSLFLQINFDPKRIDKLLAKSITKVELPRAKSPTLIWLARDVDRAKISMEEAMDSALTQILQKKAQELGVSIKLPMWDLQDINSVKAHDICHFNVDVVKAASTRYGIPLISLGCIKPPVLGKVWSSQWLLLQGTKTERFSFFGDNAESIVTQALQKMSSIIPNSLIQVSEQKAKVVLRVSNVDGLDQYNQVVRYLRDASKFITGIESISINATGVELAITIVGGQQALLNVLEMQNKLVPNSDVEDSPPGIDLDYKWVTVDDEKSQATSA